MKKENQVCTIPQAKRLKELGVIQESNDRYYEYRINAGTQTTLRPPDQHEIVNEWSAFNVAELVAMNENCYNINISDGQFTKGRYYSKTSVIEDKARFSEQFTYYTTFAEACAAKLISAIEKEWVTAEEVNKRLLEA